MPRPDETVLSDVLVDGAAEDPERPLGVVGGEALKLTDLLKAAPT